YPVRALSGPRAIALVSTTVLGALGAFMPTSGAMPQAPATVQADAQERTRLLELHRAASARLQQAVRDGTPADQIRLALRDASQSLQSLGLAPSPASTASARPALPPQLRGP